MKITNEAKLAIEEHANKIVNAIIADTEFPAEELKRLIEYHQQLATILKQLSITKALSK